MRTTSELLKTDGRAYFIFPARRRDDFITAVETSGLGVGAIRWVIPRAGEEPGLFLSECGFAPARRRELRPLVLHDNRAKYTPEARRIFEGRGRGQAL